MCKFRPHFDQLVESKQKSHLNVVVVSGCSSNVSYSSEQNKNRSDLLFWNKWLSLTKWVAQVVRDRNNVENPCSSAIRSRVILRASLLGPQRPLFWPKFANFCNSTTRHSIVLESCLNHIWIRQVFWFTLKKSVSGLGSLWRRHKWGSFCIFLANFTRPWAPT